MHWIATAQKEKVEVLYNEQNTNVRNHKTHRHSNSMQKKIIKKHSGAGWVEEVAEQHGLPLGSHKGTQTTLEGGSSEFH